MRGRGRGYLLVVRRLDEVYLEHADHAAPPNRLLPVLVRSRDAAARRNPRCQAAVELAGDVGAELRRPFTQQRLKMMLGRSNTAIHPSRIDRLMMIDFEADQMVRSAASHWWWANAMIFSDIFFLPQRILPLCGPAEISQDAMKAFGLSARGMQEPEAVIHNVKTDRKFIAGPKYKPLTAVRERPKPARAHACQAALALTRTLSASQWNSLLL